MNITLGKCSDDPRVIDKKMSSLASYSGSLKNDCSIMRPTVRITGSISAVAGANYMYIPDFQRYYYITDIVSVANNVFEVSGRVDVLKSNAADIKGSNGIACRSATNYDLFLDDGNFKLHANPKIITHSFPAGFSYSHSTYLLMVSG